MTSATTNRSQSSLKIRLTIALKLRPTSRETPGLQRLLNAEKAIKSPSKIRQYSVQVKESLLHGGNFHTEVREWEKGKMHEGCEEGWFDGFVVDWFLAGGGVIGIALDGVAVGVDLVWTGGWKYFFFSGVMFGRCVWAEFFNVLRHCLFFLKRMECFHRCFDGESFVGVFCLLVFLVCVVSLGADDAGAAGLLDFRALGGGALGEGALSNSSSFLGVWGGLIWWVCCGLVSCWWGCYWDFFSFFGWLTFIHFRNTGVFRFRGWVWHLDLCFFQRLFFCGINGLEVFLGTGFCEVADLLAVPAVQAPVLYHHRYLSFPAEYGIWDGLEALPSHTNPIYIATMSCLGSGLQLRHILKAAVGAEEWDWDFAS